MYFVLGIVFMFLTSLSCPVDIRELSISAALQVALFSSLMLIRMFQPL